MPANKRDEAPEYPFAGPFPGLQSEVAPSQIGNAGFAEVQNLMFWNARARIAPAFTPVGGSPPPKTPDGNPVMGMFDFFSQDGNRHSGVFTKSNMYEWNSGWTRVPPGATPPQYVTAGDPLVAQPKSFYQTAVVGYNLYFTQLDNKIQYYDGMTASGTPPVASYFQAQYLNPNLFPNNTLPTNPQTPPPSRYLMELDFHLIAGYTEEPATPGGPPSVLSPNRVHWSAIGNGRDWNTFTAGQTDLFNNLGPITGMTRLFQSGYIFQQWGVTQMVPTGQGLAPFQFITMGAYAKGNIIPYSLAAFGELVACYVGKDDIFVFDGTSSQPIGQHPIDGNRRLGARTRIFNDLVAATQDNVFGVIMTSALGNSYESYWLFIPSLNKAWVYNFDESSWTQFLFHNQRLNGPAAPAFFTGQILRLKDLVGPISAQTWSAASLTGGNPFDSIVIADNSVPSVSYFDFGTPSSVPTNASINASDGWYVRSGPLDFDDNRHEHTVNKVRLVLTDVASPMTFFLRFRVVTPKGQTIITPTWTVQVGRTTGMPLTIMVDLQNGISGQYITWELSGPQGVAFELVEITPYPITGGEVRWDSDFGSISAS